jgi:hypothetical protein
MPLPATPPYRLQLLGTWDLRGPEGQRIGSLLSQPKRLCLLAYLALADGPVSRAHLVALFWPDSDEVHARNALSQAVHYLRRSLTKRAVESVEGDRLWVPAEQVGFDVRALLEGRDPDGEGLEGEPLEIRAFGGAPHRDFFQGWNAEDSQPLQDWLDRTRRHVLEAIERADAAARARGEAALPGDVGARVSTHDQHEHALTHSAETGRATMRRFTRGRHSWPALVASGVAIIAMAAIIAISARSGAPSGAHADRAVVVVLLPSMNSIEAAQDTPPFPVLALRDEVVAVLTPLETARVVWSPFTETVPFVRSLAAQGVTEVEGNIELPSWAVTISVRLGHDQVRVIASLLTGREFTEVRDTRSATYEVLSDAHALLELPRRIAEELVAGFRAEIGTDQAGQ